MPTPNLDQVLAAGATSDIPPSLRDLFLRGGLKRADEGVFFGKIDGYDGAAVQLVYIDHPISPEVHLLPIGPNSAKVRTVLYEMGNGIWIFDMASGQPLFASNGNGMHCSKNLTAHISVAGHQYVESTNGFVRAATFLCSNGGVLRWLGRTEGKPCIWFDQAQLENVFNLDTTSDPTGQGASNIRAGNVISSKAAFYYNQNLRNVGEGMDIQGRYNIATIEMPRLPQGDPSFFRVTYTRPIFGPVVEVTPIAMNISNGDEISGFDPSPVMVAITKSRPEFCEFRLWQALCVPEPIQIKNYGMGVFNDIGCHLHVSSRLEVNGQ